MGIIQSIIGRFRAFLERIRGIGEPGTLSTEDDALDRPREPEPR